MLSKIIFEDEKVLAYRWEGKFDKEAFDQAMAKFEPDFKSKDRFNLYFELVDIGGMEASAIWEDLKFYSGNMKELMKKIEKVALVTDKSWLKNLAETSYKLVPGMELKSFKFDDKEVAKQWVRK